MAVRHHEEEENGEGYFASVSDLMIGILFIFLLMLTVFALNFADDNSAEIIRKLTIERDQARSERDDARRQVAKLEEALSKVTAEVKRLTADVDRLTLRDKNRENAVAGIIRRVAEIEAEISGESLRLQRARYRLLLQLQRNLSDRSVAVEISEQQDVLRLPSEEVFQIATANFTPKGLEQMTALLEEMSKLLPCHAAKAPMSDCGDSAGLFETVLIEGHTDTVRFDNWRLSTDRARAVLGLMTGPLSTLLDLRNEPGQPLIGLAGYGESRPLPKIAGTDPRNRRIEVRFLLSASREAELLTLRSRLGQLRDLLNALRDQ